jgi:DNA-binding transcriptional regulator PaaX
VRKQLPLETLLIVALGRRPGTIGMLARALRRHGVSSGSLVAAVRQLEQSGLVFRGGASGLYRLSRTGRRRLAFERALARLVGKTATRPRV